MNYVSSGVDISKGAKFVDQIAKLTEYNNSNVISPIGGFNALYDISTLGIKNPVLVSSTDGVGTKLKLSAQYHRLSTIGIDLVAMCVNDIIVSGAKPLFFLDYYATGQLNVSIGRQIISGIIEGCRQANIPLVGGETAEMPILYKNQDFDLAGFCVGIVDREQIINPQLVNAGDIIIGIASSGPHSNGFSLINQLFGDGPTDLQIIEQLLTPTKIYARAIDCLLNKINVHGIAHITGGGITENLPRILPNGINAAIELASNVWRIPPIFNIIKNEGEISGDEMLRVFNCGIGMAVVVDKTDVTDAINILNNAGERAFVIGEIIKGQGSPQVIYTL